LLAAEANATINHPEQRSMSWPARATFSCTACGKQFTITPELAGRKVRCPCGTVFVTPAMDAQNALQAGEPAPPVEDDDDGLYDFADAPKFSGKPRDLAPAAAISAPAAPISIPGLEDDAYVCPSCGQSMEPGAILCGKCGFNIKTGERVKVRPPPRTVAAASAGAKAAGGKSVAAPSSAGKPAMTVFGSIPMPKRPVVVEDKKAQLLKMVIPLSLVAILVLGIVGYKLIRHFSGAGAPVVLKGDDAKVAELIDDSGGSMELHKWFAQDPSRICGPYNTSQALAKADELDKLGAKQVLALGSRMTRVLVVELPDDPDQRKQLFQWENRFAAEHYLHSKGSVDVGQKYLLLDVGI
jgi:DNA-directed RNA polymerase subunit RPC12/RpoP